MADVEEDDEKWLQRKNFEQMWRWREYNLRYHCNFLDIAIKPVQFSKKDIVETINITSAFLGILAPKLMEHRDTVASIVISQKPENCELSYNWNMFQRIGLLTKDALTLCFLHEMCHEYLHGKRFMLFQNELWTHELAIDVICGAYASKRHLTIGHYKYVISRLTATPTHPDGQIREDAFLYGYETIQNMNYSGIPFSVEKLLRYFPTFIFTRMRKLISDWNQVKHTDWTNINNINPQLREKTKEEKSASVTLSRISPNNRKKLDDL